MSEGIDEFGGKDVDDVINMYPIIKQYKYSDHNRISLYGWSRGCLMTLLTYKKVNWVKNIILGAGEYDLTSVKEFRPQFYENLKK